MNKLIFLSLGFFLGAIACNAQKMNQGDYLVLASGDSIFGKVQYLSENDFGPAYLSKIRIQAENGPRQKFKPKKLSAFGCGGQHFEIFRLETFNASSSWLAQDFRHNPACGDYYIFQRIGQGELCHYRWHWFEQGESTPYQMDLLRRAGDSIFLRADQGLFGLRIRALTRFFSDCPRLQAKISAKELRDIESITGFYQQHCR